MYSSIELTKDGLRVERDGCAGVLVPETGPEVLQLWSWVVAAIDPGYTLGDLLALLRRVRNTESLRALLGCDVASFLTEGALAPTAAEGEGPDYLEVHNEAVPTTYEEDPDNPDDPPQFLDGPDVEAHDAVMDALNELIGEPARAKFTLYANTDENPATGRLVGRRYFPGRQNGRWSGPYHVRRGFHGVRQWREPYPGFLAARPEIDPAECVHGFALELVPVNELAHRPLRYNPEIAFGGNRRGDGVFRERITITFGELVHAIFSVVGAAGDPRTRDMHRASIARRAAEIAEDIERQLGRGEPWRGDRSGRREWR